MRGTGDSGVTRRRLLEALTIALATAGVGAATVAIGDDLQGWLTSSVAPTEGGPSSVDVRDFEQGQELGPVSILALIGFMLATLVSSLAVPIVMVLTFITMWVGARSRRCWTALGRLVIGLAVSLVLASDAGTLHHFGSYYLVGACSYAVLIFLAWSGIHLSAELKAETYRRPGGGSGR